VALTLIPGTGSLALVGAAPVRSAPGRRPLRAPRPLWRAFARGAEAARAHRRAIQVAGSGLGLGHSPPTSGCFVSRRIPVTRLQTTIPRPLASSLVSALPLYFTAVLLVAALLAGPASAYTGVLPEPPAVSPNYGNGDLVCPSHPTLASTCRLWTGRPYTGSEPARFVGQCIYCSSKSPLQDCPDEVFNMQEIDPSRQWFVRTASCDPGVACDLGYTLTSPNWWDAGVGIGGCDSAPRIP